MIQQYTLNFGKSLVENSKYVVEAVLLPVLAFYFLIDGRSLKHEFAGLMKGGRRKETLRISREFNHIMRAFISGQVIVCLLAGVVVWVGLGLLHINYSLLLGVLAGLSRAIPVIGSVIGGIPIILLTLAQTKSIPTTLTVLGFFTLLHFTESKFILPLLLGERMELHPVLIIVVLIIGGEIGSVLMGGLFGSLLGMFFAAPLASIIRVLIRRYWLRVRVRPFSSV